MEERKAEITAARSDLSFVHHIAQPKPIRHHQRASQIIRKHDLELDQQQNIQSFYFQKTNDFFTFKPRLRFCCMNWCIQSALQGESFGSELGFAITLESVRNCIETRNRGLNESKKRGDIKMDKPRSASTCFFLHSSMVWNEKKDCAKTELLLGILQFSLRADSGHLLIKYFQQWRCNILGLLWTMNIQHCCGFLSRTFKAWLWICLKQHQTQLKLENITQYTHLMSRQQITPDIFYLFTHISQLLGVDRRQISAPATTPSAVVELRSFTSSVKSFKGGQHVELQGWNQCETVALVSVKTFVRKLSQTMENAAQ